MVYLSLVSQIKCIFNTVSSSKIKLIMHVKFWANKLITMRLDCSLLYITDNPIHRSEGSLNYYNITVSLTQT